MANDPLVVYIIIRKELGMSVGKIGVQMAHAAESLMDRFFKLCLIETKIHETTCQHHHIEDISSWKKAGSTKIAKQASDAEWNSIKEILGNECIIIKDAGKTEVKPGTETVLILWPTAKSQAHKLIRELDLL